MENTPNKRRSYRMVVSLATEVCRDFEVELSGRGCLDLLVECFDDRTNWYHSWNVRTFDHEPTRIPAHTDKCSLISSWTALYMPSRHGLKNPHEYQGIRVLSRLCLDQDETRRWSDRLQSNVSTAAFESAT